MSSRRRRWYVPEFDDDPELQDDEMIGRVRRAGGFVRGGLVAVLVFGTWIVISARQDGDIAQFDPSPPPRALIAVPADYRPTGLVEPDLALADGSEGSWALLAEPGDRLFSGRWATVSCRSAGRREVGRDNDVIEATLGGVLASDMTTPNGDRIVTAGLGGASSVVAMDDGPSTIVTIITAGWTGDLASLASEVLDTAREQDCDSAIDAAGAGADLPVRQRRSLDAPLVPIGLRMISADESTVAWSGPTPNASITLTSVRAGGGGDDADLATFLRPIGEAERAVDVAGFPGWIAGDGDGGQRLVWVTDGVVRVMIVGPGAAIDATAAIELASTLRDPTDAEWEAVVAATAG